MGKLALIGAILLGSHAHVACHYHLAVTGGQTSNAPIVLAVSNTCDPPGGGYIRKRVGTLSFPAVPASCPAGTPVQTITVVNQANVQSAALAKVENAVVAQSLQLHAAWGTPCVQFGPGGWQFDLLSNYEGDPGAAGAHGEQIAPIACDACSHQGQSFPGTADQLAPSAWINTYGQSYRAWSVAFSHETMEMLVNPYPTDAPRLDANGNLVEICDAAEGHAYMLDGVRVEDFVLPPGSRTDDETGALMSPRHT